MLDVIISGGQTVLTAPPVFGKEADASMTLAPSELRLNDFDTISVSIGELTAAFRGAGYQTAGGTASYEYLGKHRLCGSCLWFSRSFWAY